MGEAPEYERGDGGGDREHQQQDRQLRPQAVARVGDAHHILTAAISNQAGTKIFAASAMPAALAPQSQPNSTNNPRRTTPPPMTISMCIAISSTLRLLAGRTPDAPPMRRYLVV